MVYLADALKYKRRIDLEDARIESIWVEIMLKSYNILVCCFYRSDFIATPSNFITHMQPSIEEALDYTPYVVLVGDINIDFINMNNTQLRDCLSMFNLNNVITEPTRITANSVTLIDPVLVTDSCDVLNSGIIPVDAKVSDHRATYISLKINLCLSNCYYRDVWIYKHADYTTLNNLIERFNWDEIINETVSIDESCEKFTNIFSNFCKACIPSKKVLIRENDKPWFTSELRYNIRVRDRLRKTFFKSRSNTDRLLFNRQRNKVNNMKKYAKENYINNIDNIISNQDTGYASKNFWKIMGRFMGKKASSVCIPPLYIDNNKYAYTNIEKADTLNIFFSSISTIDDANVPLPDFEKRTDSVLSQLIINPSEILDVLKVLKVNKATGPDGISHRMLKNTSKTIAIPLTKLYNLSLKQCKFPSLWKVAHVMPLFKKGDKSDVNNYRPVSLISCVGKSFERVVHKHVYNHIVTHSLLYKYQSGFIPGHSTVHHLIEVIHHTCLALENYETSCQIFCDISKAFDRVWHRGLIHKLNGYGLSGDLLKWFENYLSARKQKVIVHGAMSSEKILSAGVPQGSVLGPLLFLLYINDIADKLTGMARLFADDTSLSFSSTDLATIEFILNNDLVQLSKWATHWLITFNPLKTEVMLISNIYNDYNLEFKYNNTILNIVDTHKHLGVIISSDNKWNKHIDSIIDTASRQLSYLRKVKYLLPKEILNKLYCTYIRPILEYASEVWDGCNLTDANRLEQVQMIAARIVTGLPTFASLQSLYYETGWETLAERRKQKKLNLMYKIVNNEAPTYLKDLLPNTVNDASTYNLRNSSNYNIPFSRLCSFQSSFFPSTLRLWNDLGIQIRASQSLSQFKGNIKKQPLKIIDYLSVGDRKTNIILTRLRHKCSSLNADLFKVNIIPYSNCDCGAQLESAEHFFFECNLFTAQRQRLIGTLKPNLLLNLDLLTNGTSLCDFDENKNIILAVLKFIKDTHRFN